MGGGARNRMSKKGREKMRFEERMAGGLGYDHRRDTGARTPSGDRIVYNTHDGDSPDRQTVYRQNERGITSKIDGTSFNPKTGKFSKK